jgi:hypothetical protein
MGTRFDWKMYKSYYRAGGSITEAFHPTIVANRLCRDETEMTGPSKGDDIPPAAYSMQEHPGGACTPGPLRAYVADRLEQVVKGRSSIIPEEKYIGNGE